MNGSSMKRPRKDVEMPGVGRGNNPDSHKKKGGKSLAKAEPPRIDADSADSDPDCQKIAKRFGYTRVIKVTGSIAHHEVEKLDRTIHHDEDTWPGHLGEGYYGFSPGSGPWPHRWDRVGSMHSSIESLLR